MTQEVFRRTLKEPDDGDLVIVGDGSQSLYRKRPYTWKDEGVHASGRTINTKFDLDRNYRNTAEILAAAHSFAGHIITPERDDVALRQMRGDCITVAALLGQLGPGRTTPLTSVLSLQLTGERAA